VVVTAATPDSPPPALDQRRDARRRCARDIDIVPCGGGGRIARLRRVGLCDCSMAGLGLRARAPMRPGEQFLLQVRVGRHVRVAAYTVRQCARA
jgi:hypothetical protein